VPINNKQRAFIEEYMVNGHNASKAYSKAYPDCKSGARHAASLLLTNINIKEEIANRMAELKEQTGWSVDISLTKLKTVIAASMANNQYSSAVSGIVAANRLFNLDQPQDTDQNKELDESERAAARRIANITLTGDDVKTA